MEPYSLRLPKSGDATGLAESSLFLTLHRAVHNTKPHRYTLHHKQHVYLTTRQEINYFLPTHPEHYPGKHGIQAKAKKAPVRRKLTNNMRTLDS